jgi:hypothetical protein
VLDARGNLARLTGDFASAERDHREVAAVEPMRVADAEFALALDLAEEGRREEALALVPRLPPPLALQVRALTGDAEAAAQVLAQPPHPDPEGVAWTATAVASNTLSAEPALRRFAAQVDTLGLAGIAWRVRADLAALARSRPDAETAIRGAEALAALLPEERRAKLLAHPALERCRAVMAATQR